MKSNLNYKESKVYSLLSTVIVNSDRNLFKDSKIIAAVQKISFPKLSFDFLVLSLFCSFYESFFAGINLAFVQNYNLSLLFLLLSVIFCNKKRLKSTKPIIYLILFILTLLISGLVASINGLDQNMIITGIMLFCQFALAYVISSTYVYKDKLVDAILILATPAVLVGIFQGVLNVASSKLWVSTSENLVDNRAYAFFGSPNILGSLAMIVTIIAVVKFIESRKYQYLLFSIISTIVLVYTFSRSAWIGLAAGLVIILLFKNYKLLLFSPAALLLFAIPSVRQRISVPMSQEYMVDSALDGRIWANNNASDIWQNNSIIGTGPGSYGGQTAIYNNSPVYLDGMQNGYVALPYADNQWLQILVQTGIVGILFVAMFFISQFVNNFIQFKKNGSMLSIGVIAVSIAIIINGFFANIWEFSAIAVLSGSYLGLGNNYDE